MTNPWAPHELAPVTALATLRRAVLTRSEKRSPKWKFRLAADLVVQVQPKAGTRCQFECVAVMCEGANAAVFASSLPRLDRDWWLMRFDIVVEPSRWQLKARRYRWRRGAERERYFDLRVRTFEAFDGGNRFAAIAPDLMLSPNCLICGKGLTDPASMARFIGPECAGTSSLAVPQILGLGAVVP
jgi:hypothetical protein